MQVDAFFEQGSGISDVSISSSRSRLKRGLTFRQGAMLLLEAQPFKQPRTLTRILGTIEVPR